MTINRLIEYSYFSESDWYPFKHFVKYEIVQFILALLLAAPLVFLKKSFRIYQLILIPFWLYMILEFAHVYMFQGFPNSATYFSIFTTNSTESVEFLNDYFTWKLLFLILTYLISLLTAGFFIKNLMRQHERAIKIAFLSSTFLGIILFGYSKITNRLAPISFNDNGLIQTFVQYNQYKTDQLKFQDIANIKISFDQLKRKLEHKEKETHVIVIGESTSKHHMYLYGYQRQTNPLLSKEPLKIFEHAISPNAHTVPALEKALTFKSSTNSNLGIENGSIIDIVNQAGYDTYWLSNQAFSGEHETPISVMASKADYKTYTNAIGTSNTLDLELKKPFINSLKSDKSKVIFIHLMGTHLSYEERYPSSFNIFNDTYNAAGITWDDVQQGYINAYDNAIAYNDNVVSTLLEEVKKENGICTFTYFSDHGDEVYDFRNFHGHSDVLLSKYMYDIPLLFWANESFKTTRSESMSTLEQNLNGVFNSENLIHFWCDVFDIYTEFYQPLQSPLSIDYNIDSSAKELPIITVKTKNDINFKNKLWCHRVNSIERLKEAKEFFTGFEIDLVYQHDGWFDVNHPPAESIELQLKQLIKSTLQPDKYEYWLDMKNLTTENSNDAALLLKQIAQNFNCTGNIIVESSCLSCLQAFDSLGFKTALYLPFLHDLSEEEQHIELQKINNALESFQPSALTQERDGYVLLKKHFPNCDVLSWDTQTEFTNTNQIVSTKQFLQSENRLKVLLIRFDSANWR